LDSLDSPRPGLGGSHHLPPYSILCVALRHPHPNGFSSRDSQGGVSKLSRFGLLGLWELITPGSNLRLGWGLKQTCSSPQELSNGVSHFICTHRDRVNSWRFVVGSQTTSLTPGSNLRLGWGLKQTCSSPQELSNCVSHFIFTHRDRVNSWLFVVGSQTTSLTPGPSFAHNLCCKCPNGSCEAILDIYTSRPFQRYKEHFKARCFAFCCRALKLQESQRTPNSHFWECESHSHTCLKVGLRHGKSNKKIWSINWCQNVALCNHLSNWTSKKPCFRNLLASFKPPYSFHYLN